MNKQLILTSFKKEIWEFKKTLIWVPAVIASLIVILPIVQLFLLEGYQFDRIFEGLSQVQYHNALEGFHADVLVVMSALFSPFLMIGLIVQFFYFLSCLYDERRDISVYFWRSMPVSDATTVAVKLTMGAIIIPAIFMIGATVTLIFYLLLALVFSVISAVGFDVPIWALWANSGLISNLGTIWVGLLPYALWMFPLFAWLMLASMFAKRAPFLWAVLPVVVLLVIESIVVQYMRVDQGYFSRLLLEYFAFTKDLFPHEGIVMHSHSFSVTSALFSKVSFVGILFGAALIYATYWLRANRSHG